MKPKFLCPTCGKVLGKRRIELHASGLVLKCPCGFMLQAAVAKIDKNMFATVSSAAFLEPPKSTFDTDVRVAW